MAAVTAIALAAAGLVGAYSYAQDYNLHRGFATLVQFRRAGTGRLEEVHFYSRALHREADYLVYLPPHYSVARRYPVYYLLHGAPGKPRVFVDIANMDVRLDNQIALGRARAMILVFPDGRIGGSTFSDSEWANTPSGDFESYVIDVVQNVDQRFAAIPSRQDRVIAGFSAGAYGAMNIALHHLADFANVQSWSGYFTQTRTGVFAHASPGLLAYNSPFDYVTRLRRALARYPLRVYMFVGRDDPSAAQQLPMAHRLIAAGAEVQYRFYPGGHDWSVWYPRLNQMLDLASSETRSAPVRRRQAPVAAAGASSAGALAGRISAPFARHLRHRPRARSLLQLIGALLLALLSAALINLGFVLQHRGHHRARRHQASFSGGFRQPAWLAGQTVGWIGFAGQIVAVALAPLTLVQAFSAGSLALSVPLAARVFGHRVTREQLGAIVLIALGLAVLPLGFGQRQGHLQPGLLIACALAVMLAAGLLSLRGGKAALAIGAGAFYGAADAGIKAAAIGLRFHGAGVLTGWTLLAAVCTFAGFLAFQAALRAGDAVGPMSLMNVFTALVAIAFGLAAFGEPLGSGPLADALHAAAIVMVLACVRPLARAQQQLVDGDVAVEAVQATPSEHARGGPSWRSPLALARGLSGALLAFAALLCGTLAIIGLLYGMRQAGVLGFGPRVPDALPLLQLAGFASQPLGRVLAAALLAGMIPALALARLERKRRVLFVAVFSLALMLLDSDASFALARNLRFAAVLRERTPGLGPWLQALLFTAASAFPGRRPSLAIGSRRPTQRIAPGWQRAHKIAVRGRPVALWGAGTAALLSLLMAASVIALGSSSGPAGATQATKRGGVGARRPKPPISIHSSGASTGARLRGASARRRHSQSLGGMLEAVLERQRARAHAPAATAAVVRCGRVVWAGAAGFSDLSPAQPASDQSLFVLNSAVKTIIATMIMQEVQTHRLSLGTRLSRFYPQLPNASAVTIRMLLNMTSGLPDYLDNPRIRWTINHRPRHRWTVAQILSGLGSGLGGSDFFPGLRYQYSDTNYIVLGAILRRVTNRSIQQDFERLIGRPLGITSATFVPTATAKALIAHPYLLHRHGRLSSLWIAGYGVSSGVWGPVFTDGGMAASALDLARFANALLGGQLLPASAVGQMTSLGRHDYGFGIQGRLFAGRSWLGHVGVFGGYGAEDWTDPSRGLTIAVAVNVQRSSGGNGLISDHIWRALVHAYDKAVPAQSGCTALPTT